MFRILETEARSILSPVTGFLREAGFSHSLSPARNCTYGCTYCYVPTMGIYGGLKPEDWRHWGEFTTFKSNAAARLARELRGDQVIYCSPLTDPWQPAERQRRLMPAILEAVTDRPPAVFALQTRSPLILRDLELLRRLSEKTAVAVSFSVTTDDDAVRRKFEPHCEPNTERLAAIEQLRQAGLRVYATLAPILPCNPERLAELALVATTTDLVGDPLHVRAAKPRGATSRAAALKIAQKYGWEEWFEPSWQQSVIERMDAVARSAGRRLVIGPPGFGLLAGRP